MKQHILIIGAGFGGVWSALGAARLLDKNDRHDVQISVLAPRPELRIRPRFYEAQVHTMQAPLSPLFAAVGVNFIEGTADSIDENARQVTYRDLAGNATNVQYDRLLLAAGSRLNRPPMEGIEHVFDVDQIEDATRLEAHIHALNALPDSPARNTVVVGRGRFYRHRDRHRNASAPA